MGFYEAEKDGKGEPGWGRKMLQKMLNIWQQINVKPFYLVLFKTSVYRKCKQMRITLYKVEEDMIKRLDKHDCRWDTWRVKEEEHRVLVKEIEAVLSFGTRSTFLPSVRQEPQIF